ncbi:DUF5994 family protein [Mycolicibacterium arseniciresistens]|uniref:DUF5994 family protein n=1 Tax=Mycolicibacterium arseniciresistens TaxID=3062257 RepID=A0ABT8U9K2_9MYCO|nr:DUF5994 family protein [Mycolicibacterium arseniciresistens]MDO3634479.1 DUF5994 family protein [Mycolicibacterium arseniciresistens]
MAVQEDIRAASGAEAERPRLRLKDSALATGYVDGAWWPHSGDLTVEIPELLEGLSAHVHPIARVTYGLAEWAPVPAKLITAGGVVRMDGYGRQPSNTIGVSDGRGHEVILLVVPAKTDPDRAHAIVMAASGAGDASSTQHLLATDGKAF